MNAWVSNVPLVHFVQKSCDWHSRPQAAVLQHVPVSFNRLSFQSHPSHSTALQVPHTLWPFALDCNSTYKHQCVGSTSESSEAIKLSCQVTIARAWLTCPSSLGSPNSIESRGAHLFTAHLLGIALDIPCAGNVTEVAAIVTRHRC